ncbi:MAG TPA: hypothetical protein VE261_06630 [Gaiellaceae bacterium]|nr:hypothetical protein [Gaiellaceae bacterium]
MFLASVSGGLIALGLVATAARVGTAFYAFGLVLLPTLSFVGFITFERVVQCLMEDVGLLRQLDLLRQYYFDNAPELGAYLVRVTPLGQLRAQGLVAGFRRQGLLTVAGMIGVITAVLAGATAAMIAILAFDHSLAAALTAGAAVGIIVAIGLLRLQLSAVRRTIDVPLVTEQSEALPVRRS